MWELTSALTPADFLCLNPKSSVPCLETRSTARPRLPSWVTFLNENFSKLGGRARNISIHPAIYLIFLGIEVVAVLVLFVMCDLVTASFTVRSALAFPLNQYFWHFCDKGAEHQIGRSLDTVIDMWCDK